MNLKTTIALIVLAGAGVGGWVWWELRKPVEQSTGTTAAYLQSKLAADKVSRVEVTRRPKSLDEPRFAASMVGMIAQPAGPLLASATMFPRVAQTRFVLERHGKEWSLPGNWPVRPNETEQWLAVLTSLRSRFTPIVLEKNARLTPYGLEDDPLTVKVTVGDETHTLRFGEEKDPANRFARATFVQLDKQDEVIQLGPGVFAALDRSLDYFRQRRLFPVERVARDDESAEKVEQLAATEVEVQTKTAWFTIAKKDKVWRLQEASKKAAPVAEKKPDQAWQRVCSIDRIDPARRETLLRGFTDLWAERFVEGKSLQECGLAEPEFVVSVTKPNGARIKLLIGAVSETKSKFEMKTAMPGMPPQPQMIKEEYRFAKLDKNDQLFEIKADKLRDIALDLDDLRDPMLARFKTGDVRRLEIRHGALELILAKSKEGSEAATGSEKWRLIKPTREEADPKVVEDLLTDLAGLRASGKDIHDDADAKKFGLDAPAAQVKITVEEVDKDSKKKGDDKDAPKKSREIVLRLGKKADVKDRLFVRVDDWPRVNEIGGELDKQLARSELAYKPRELWKVDRDAITRITIQADAAPYHLEQSDKGWKITGPLQADTAAKEIDTLANDLAHLQAERFEAVKVKDFTPFGLDKPEFKITVAAKDGKQHAIEVGKKTTDKEPGRFARSAGGDTVFVLNEKTLAQVRKDPSDFLDKNLWTLKPTDIHKIRYEKFALEAKQGLWQVTDAPVPKFVVDDAVLAKSIGPLLQLRAQKYAAFGGKIDFAKFGLDKPAATVTLTATAAEGAKPAEHVVELGKEAPEGGRYVRVDKKDAVAVIDRDVAMALQASYLDFVDTRILRFDGDAVMSIERKMKDADLELTRREDNWLITKPGTRDADILTINDLLRRTSQLQARRIAAYPAKDLAPFGLDKPVAVITLIVEIGGDTSKHVIKVGNVAGKDTDERFALVDARPMVVVLPAELSRHLTAPVLYYADRNLASFSAVDRAELTSGARKVVFTRSDSGWKVTEPIAAAADDTALNEIVRSVQRLRADEIIAEKATDLKKYGFDQPLLQWRLKLGDAEQLNLIVGAAENDKPDARRYAKLGDKAAVFVLSAKLVEKLQRECRDRRPWPTSAGDTVSKVTIYGAGKKLPLKRMGMKFAEPDEPTMKLKVSEAMTLFNVLEAMRVVRYVADAKADLKQYGLAEPASKIDIEIGKDSRTLLLGGAEDKSKRRYATVAGSGAVFVIDEIDALILARPIEAYVETEKKK